MKLRNKIKGLQRSLPSTFFEVFNCGEKIIDSESFSAQKLKLLLGFPLAQRRASLGS